MKEELEKVKTKCRVQEEEWKREREELKGRVKELENKVTELKEMRSREGVGAKGRTRKKDLDNKIKGLERWIEKREREDRKKNIVIKGLEVKEGRRKEAVEEIMEKIEVKAKIEEIKRVGFKTMKEKEMVMVKLTKEEQRREILRKKSNLKERKEVVCKDWT